MIVAAVVYVADARRRAGHKSRFKALCLGPRRTRSGLRDSPTACEEPVDVVRDRRRGAQGLTRRHHAWALGVRGVVPELASRVPMALVTAVDRVAGNELLDRSSKRDSA